MPIALRPHVLKALYEDASRRIAGGDIPTVPVAPSLSWYRSFDIEHFKLSTRGIFRKQYANQPLFVRDQGLGVNGFSASLPTPGSRRGGLMPLELSAE